MLRHKDELYTMTFANPTTIRIGEYDVVLPDMPDEKLMINYSKKLIDQKYHREVIPKDIASWTKPKIEEYVEAQWHRRIHGQWWLIKGQPIYIPGPTHLFFDYWKRITGGLPDFRMEAIELFQYWYLHVEPDPNCFGAYIIKPRRIGETEKFLFIAWERTTRYRNVKAGLQSYTDVEGSKNFNRLAKGARNMPFFFKPNRSGSDKECLAYMAPNEVMTYKKIKDKIGLDAVVEEEGIKDDDFLGSYIDYEATVTGKYDGDQLHTYFLDEVIKIPVKKMDVKEQWNNIRRAATLYNERYIYGRGILSSTIEEKSKEKGQDVEDSTVEVAKYFWEGSDPNDRDENGRTATGLYRLFRGFEYAAEVDEWGFHKVAEARIFRENKIASLQRKGDTEGLLNLMRKEPASAEDALTQISDKQVLHPDLCIVRLNQLKQGLDRWSNPIENYAPKVIVGDLVWKNSIPNTQIEFIPNKNGKWHISQVPRTPNHVSSEMVRNKIYSGQTFVPRSAMFYAMGADPYDAPYTIGKGSDGAFSVKRRLYMPDEKKNILFDETGSRPMNPEDMITNTYVCDYKHRPKNPYDFYEDVVKTCWWYGCRVFPEMDKPGLSQWMIANGYYGFLQYEPAALVAASARRKRRPGTKASEAMISMYIEKLQAYIFSYIYNVNHPRIIAQWKDFIPAKRTKYDLAVATGFTELADDSFVQVKEDKEDEQPKWVNSPFENSYHDS